MQPEPSPQAVTFATTEHFTLQTARTATIAESNGRANIFLAAVSGGLVALAFLGQVTELGTGFIVFGLVLLPVLLFIGVATFDRTIQSAIEDVSYALRINDVRRYYLDAAPELVGYLEPPVEGGTQLVMENIGLRSGRLQPFLTTAGMVEVIDAVLAGALAAFVVAAIDRGQLAGAVIAGVVVGVAVLIGLHLAQLRVWAGAELESHAGTRSHGTVAGQ